MNDKFLTTRSWLIVAVALTLAACASTRTQPTALVEARHAVDRLTSEPMAARFSEDTEAARSELATAERLFEDGADESRVSHHAYLATQLAALVHTQAARTRAEDEIGRADEERQRLLLAARERQAAAALSAAKDSRIEAQLANTRADRQAAMAEDARQAAIAAQKEAEELSAELEELNAKRTTEGARPDVDGCAVRHGQGGSETRRR